MARLVGGDSVIRYPTEQHLAEAVKAGTKVRYLVGCDLGQAVDFTAISVIERTDKPKLEMNKGVPTGRVKFDTGFAVRDLQRLERGTSYVQQVEHIAKVMATAPLSDNAKLIVDRSGVGRGVFDMLVDADLKPVGITITAGEGSSKRGYTSAYRGYNVSKLELVGQLVATAHRGELKVSKKLSLAQVLQQELQDFRVSYTDSGYSKFGARSGKHDDLVLSVAVAIWWSRHAEGAKITVSKLQGF